MVVKKRPKIIGVSGRIGSGKDLVGSIIQNLTAKERYGYLENTWEVKKWAGKLKTIASLLTGIPTYKFEDQEFKKTYLPKEWNYWTISLIDNGKLLLQHGRYNTKEEAEGFIPFLKQSYGEFRMEYVAGMQQMTARQFLQELGTDALRNSLHPNTWVNALMADYTGTYDMDTDLTTYPNWVITDTRFPNEAEAIKEAGGIIIRVTRTKEKSESTHSSETALDDWTFDYEINNNGTIEELSSYVYSILKKENIL